MAPRAGDRGAGRPGHSLERELFYTEDELVAAGLGHDALMGAGGHTITRSVIEALPSLRCVSKYGIGTDTIDVAAATEHGVVVTNTPTPLNVEAAAEHTITLILAALKRLDLYTTAYLRGGGWRSDQWASLLRDRTVGIVGLGRVGRGVARRLEGWGCRLLATDPHATEVPEGVEVVGLDSLLRAADVVTLHAAATADNRHLIGGPALHQVKPTAVLVNTARGSLVDLDAVHDALCEGRLGAVALDVYDPELPTPEHPLFRLPRVLATPHSASWSEEALREIGFVGARNVQASSAARPSSTP